MTTLCTNLETNLDRLAAAGCFRRAAAARRHLLAHPYLADQEERSIRFWRASAQTWRVLAANRSPAWARELDRLLSGQGVVQ